MRLTKEELSIRVIVRRAKRGAAPFVWEINGADTAEPLYVSPEQFRSMEAAYIAGQARLPEFVPSRRAAATPAMTDRHLDPVG